MRICPDHWAKLRAAIEARGLSHLVAQSGEQAHENMVTELQGGEAPYDPLMSCNWMISSNGLRAGGLYLMGQKEDGSHYCPICEAVAHKPDDVTVAQVETYWIDGPTNAALEECRRRGLVAAVQ